MCRKRKRVNANNDKKKKRNYFEKKETEEKLKITENVRVLNIQPLAIR